jgi:hypothetical protein
MVKLSRSVSIKSWDNLVSILTGHGLDGQGSIPDKEKIFLFFTADFFIRSKLARA